MNYTVRDLQGRVNALNPTSPIDVDGMRGPGTRGAVTSTLIRLGLKEESELFHDSGLHRIIWHWSGGLKVPTKEDLKHYNDMHDHEGNSYDGAARAEHQANYDWRKGVGVSHSRNCNTGTIGQAVAGMHGAEGWPTLKWHSHAITWPGIDSMLERSAEYCKEFDIPVTKWSTLSHAEIEQTLGIKQNNKWDYMVLPGDSSVRNAVVIGNILRNRMITKFM
jgi:hypothetical protein